LFVYYINIFILFLLFYFILFFFFFYFVVLVANGTFEEKRQEDFAKIVSFSNTLVRDHESKEWLLLLGRDATKDEVKQRKNKPQKNN